MPELPEVEVVARTIRSEIQGKEISDVDVFWPRIIKHPDDQEEFKARLIGETIGDIGRTGKYLKIGIGDKQELVIHFRMTGKLKLLRPEDSKQKHIHLYFHFEGEQEGLAYHDVRKFGDIFLVPKGDYRAIKGLFQAGVDPLSEAFTFDLFQSLIKPRKRRIKALLLDQSVITGLGNYLCDEMLWIPGEQGVHPERLASSLSEAELQKIYRRMLEVIQTSIRLGGNSFRDFSYANGIKGEFKRMLKVYGRKGEPCANCGTEIERKIVAGRSTHYCPRCQPECIADHSCP